MIYVTLKTRVEKLSNTVCTNLDIILSSIIVLIMSNKNSYHVVTTINNPTAITCTAKGKFLDSDYDNLIVW